MTPEKKEEKEKETPQEPSIEELKEKLAKTEKDLKEADKKADRYFNQLKYSKADLQNIQKQNQKRIQDIIERANGQLLELLLPILDELFIIKSTDSSKEKLQEGINIIHKKLEKVMFSHGIEPIHASGEPFDPFKHEAIMEVETEDYQEGWVIDEVRGGYMYKDRVLRPSVVKVACSPNKEVENQDE
jgi:molecular chaperone GrpE